MTLSRRKFLHLVPASTIGITAGCSGAVSEEPDTEIIETVKVDSRLISSDRAGSDFTVTAQNTGIGGNIAIGFFWQMQEQGMKPQNINSQTDAYDFERKNELYFDTNERRTVEFTASPPEDAVGYYFLTRPATYGARIRNSGGGGRITVTMNYTNRLDLSVREEETVHIEEGATKEVLFNVKPKEGTEWEIQTKPAE